MFKIRGMRGLLTSSIGVTCAAALTLPPAVLNVPSAAAAPAERTTTTTLQGTTQSLPLAPRTRERVPGRALEQGVYSTDVRHFSLVGVIWDNPGTELGGRVQVRTRAAATGRWSGWQDVETRNADHGADPGSAEAASGRVHGATAPLWVGDSNGVDVRVRAGEGKAGGDGDGDAADAGPGGRPSAGGPDPLPAGLRLELVDPGGQTSSGQTSSGETPSGGSPLDGPPPLGLSSVGLPPDGPSSDGPSSDGPSDEGSSDEGSSDEGSSSESPSVESPSVEGSGTADDASADVNADPAPADATEIPALNREDTELELEELTGVDVSRVKPYIGPRPKIVTRRGWGADESLREKGFVYTGKIKAAFVHHTASGNGYRCSEAPSVIRSIYRYHVVSMGWRDIGYNFLVDKCGTIYEGRAGGVTKAVRGAHTLGFNNNSMGIAVIGTYGSHQPSSAAVTAVAKLTAWKLGLFGANPKGKTYLKSGGGNLYPKGKNVRLNVISGHRDGYATECPGAKLYAKLGSARTSSARLQGR
ncbi:peptidoglycan recognition protein [Streptomyces sp. NPDC101234]|uniref:peptidoglycan recognition protein family protein n=1 Tax=Streptomyces sp. NPDC101234 TaxID=3366138 RepID=UPI00381E2B4B